MTCDLEEGRTVEPASKESVNEAKYLTGQEGKHPLSRKLENVYAKNVSNRDQDVVDHIAEKVRFDFKFGFGIIPKHCKETQQRIKRNVDRSQKLQIPKICRTNESASDTHQQKHYVVVTIVGSAFFGAEQSCAACGISTRSVCNCNDGKHGECHTKAFCAHIALKLRINEKLNDRVKNTERADAVKEAQYFFAGIRIVDKRF